jgi:hypothetical protein
MKARFRSRARRAEGACFRALVASLLVLAGCGEPELSPTFYRAARQEIRPTDGTGWQGNGYGAVTVLHWDTPGGKLRVHYTKEGTHAVPSPDADGSGVPDFVEQFGKTFDLMYAAEIGTLGFRPPLDDSVFHDRPDYGGDGRFDVYLQNQPSGADGYIVVEACNSLVPRQCAGYMVVENDFVGFSYPTPQDGMKVLSSHEFFHIVQNAYRSELARTWSEATAVWMTEQVFPEQKDFESFVPFYFKNANRSLEDEGGPSDSFPYALAIWPRFLSEKYGVDVIRAVFEELSEKGKAATELDAVDAVLKRDHQSSLSEAFATFALWNYFTGNRAGGISGYQAAASLPEVAVAPVAGSLPQRVSGEIAYLSMQVYKVTAPAGTRVKVVVERTQPELALHLCTGDPKQPKIVSIMPDKQSASIESKGEVTMIVASTARKDRHLPLSLAVTEEPSEPVKPTPNPPPPEPPPSSSEEGGCALAGAGVPAASWLWLGLLGVLGFARRRRAVAGLALVALALVPGCSDPAAPPLDAGREAAAVEARVPDQRAPDRAPPSPDGPTTLAVGGFQDFEPDAAGKILGSTPTAGGEQYLLLLLSLEDVPFRQSKYTIATGGTQPMTQGGVGSKEKDSARPIRRCRFQQQLDEIFASKPKALWAPKRWLAATLPPKLGEKREFKIASESGVPTKITAECIAVDATAAFWIDKTTQPLASISPTSLAEVAEGFSKIIVPRERIYFGKESDLDGDTLISVLFSPIVAASAVAYFSPCDLVDTKLVPLCADRSNGMELLYMSPPSSIPPPMNTTKAILETVAHELQHAIYFNRKYLLNGTAALASENPYITEGLSALAQDLSGYQAGNFFVAMAGLEGVAQLSLPNMTSDALKNYVPGEADGIMRGGEYLLMRYLFDRAGGDALDAKGMPVDKGGIAWLRSFEDAKETGEPAVLKTTGLTANLLCEDFWTALALSNRGPSGAPISSIAKYNFQAVTVDPLTGRERGFNLWGSFHGMGLSGPAAVKVSAADGSILSGGAEYLLMAASGNPNLTFTIESDPGAKTRARLIRIK